MKNQCIEVRELLRISEEVAKKLESKTNSVVLVASFPNNTNSAMKFLVFCNSQGSPSTQKYKLVACNFVQNISDIDAYVDFLMKCLDSKIYIQGNINSMSRVVYNITNDFEGFVIYDEGIADKFYLDDNDLFYINEEISIKASVEHGTLTIRDSGFGYALIDFNRKSYSIQEVASVA